MKITLNTDGNEITPINLSSAIIDYYRFSVLLPVAEENIKEIATHLLAWCDNKSEDK